VGGGGWVRTWEGNVASEGEIQNSVLSRGRTDVSLYTGGPFKREGDERPRDLPRG